jgi:hypothetical protein
MKGHALLTAGLVLASAAAVAWAAPGVKSKPEPLGPITEEQLAQSTNNLKLIGLAWHNYHDTIGHFPCNQVSKDGKPLLSWRVQILAYLEEDQLYKQFRLDEPWDSDHNKKLIDKMPKIFGPVRAKADSGMTFYQVFTGKHGLIKSGEKRAMASVTDGLSNTFMCVEAAKPVVWTKPDDLVFDGTDVPAVGGLFDGKFHAVMGDGSVRRFRKEVNAETMRRLIDPQDGQVIDIDSAEDKGEEKK